MLYFFTCHITCDGICHFYLTYFFVSRFADTTCCLLIISVRTSFWVGHFHMVCSLLATVHNSKEDKCERERKKAFNGLETI